MLVKAFLLRIEVVQFYYNGAEYAKRCAIYLSKAFFKFLCDSHPKSKRLLTCLPFLVLNSHYK